MRFKHGIAGVVALATFTIPFAAVADPNKDESGHGNCYEHKGKMKCRGKDKRKKKFEYEAEGEHTAGGPPPWAPAHGWRRKHGSAGYEVRREVEYERPVVVERAGMQVVVSNGAATVDVGIEQGTCNRKAIGTVVGGIIGGAIGNRVGDRNNREISTVLGVVVGGMVGHKVGSSMDNADQHCTGQVLEQAPDNQTVRWGDHSSTGQYSVTPLRTYQTDGMDCRDFITEHQGANGIERERSSACRNSDGAWSKYTM